MQRAMELAARVAAVDRVDAFGRLAVAFAILRADRMRTEGDGVCLHDAPVLQQREPPRALLDEDAVGVDRRRDDEEKRKKHRMTMLRHARALREDEGSQT